MKILKIFLILSSLVIFSNADDYKHKYKNLDYLNLNNSQTNDFKKILYKYKKLYKDFHEYEETQEKRIEEIMKNDNFDKLLYLEIMGNISIKKIHLEANQMEDIHKILNAKQRERFAKYLEEWKDD